MFFNLISFLNIASCSDNGTIFILNGGLELKPHPAISGRKPDENGHNLVNDDLRQSLFLFKHHLSLIYMDDHYHLKVNGSVGFGCLGAITLTNLYIPDRMRMEMCEFVEERILSMARSFLCQLNENKIPELLVFDQSNGIDTVDTTLTNQRFTFRLDNSRQEATHAFPNQLVINMVYQIRKSKRLDLEAGEPTADVVLKEDFRTSLKEWREGCVKNQNSEPPVARRALSFGGPSLQQVAHGTQTEETATEPLMFATSHYFRSGNIKNGSFLNNFATTMNVFNPNVKPPIYLTVEQRDEFQEIVEQLILYDTMILGSGDLLND
ncbi:hypothetical protein ECANGB1_857 [Enterospora canceri]|uniref:Uncharacterized protein n=1 Tax=Enterospora canceri TaxID=1081671 RepID=A0A1Y1S789_9MICR|nr:hypothetical protein ECANGB1_857 [Enterospora canceri]